VPRAPCDRWFQLQGDSFRWTSRSTASVPGTKEISGARFNPLLRRSPQPHPPKVVRFGEMGLPLTLYVVPRVHEIAHVRWDSGGWCSGEMSRADPAGSMLMLCRDSPGQAGIAPLGGPGRAVSLARRARGFDDARSVRAGSASTLLASPRSGRGRWKRRTLRSRLRILRNRRGDGTPAPGSSAPGHRDGSRRWSGWGGCPFRPEGSTDEEVLVIERRRSGCRSRRDVEPPTRLHRPRFWGHKPRDPRPLSPYRRGRRLPCGWWGRFTTRVRREGTAGGTDAARFRPTSLQARLGVLPIRFVAHGVIRLR